MTTSKRTSSNSQPTDSTSNIEYQSIVEAQGDLIVRAKPNGELIFVNKAYGAFFNLNPAQAIGQNFSQFLGPQSWQKVATHIANITPKNPIVRYQEQALKADGTTCWLEWTDRGIFDAKGQLLEIQSVGRDISRFKETEQTLKDHQAQLAAIISGAMDAIITINEAQHIVLFNQAAEAMFLCSKDEVLGQPIEQFIPSRFQALHRQHIKRFGQTGITNRQMNTLGSVWGVRRNGQEFPLEASISQVNAGGEKLYTVILRDVSEKVETERVMQETQTHLERQNQVLMALAQTQAMASGNFKTILKEITSATAQTLEVEKVSIWLFNEPKTKISCIEDYYLKTQKHTQGGELMAADYPAYFSALKKERAIAVNNALADPRTQELAESYLAPNNISSLLDAPIILQSKMAGMICCEHIGPARQWKPEEERFAASIADLVALALEIRNHKQAEQALHNSEARYRAIVEDQTEFIIRAQPNGTVTFVNQAYCAYFKKSYREMIGQNFYSFMTPQRGEIVRRKIASLTPKNPVAIDEHWTKLNSNSPRCLHWLDRGIFDADGQLIEIQSVGRDVTQRRAAQEAVGKSEARFRTLIENALDIITVLEIDGTIRYESPSIETIMGYNPEELVGKNAFDFVHPEDLPAVMQVWRETTSRFNNRYTLEFRFLHKDGSWRVLEAIGRNLLNDSNIKGIVVNSRDMTERKRLQEQLIQAQKMEVIGRLAGGIAHDFNNLLVPIMGYADLGTMIASESEKSHHFFQSIHNAAQHAAGLTQQILAFSKQQMLELKTLNLNQVILHFETMLRRLIGEDIEVALFLCQEPTTIQADNSQLEQILLNLAINARDAMPEGGKLTIETNPVVLDESYTQNHPEITPGSYILLAVSDTGYGMDDAVKSHLFEPFFTTKTNNRGTGLGLATVHGIVKQHQGHIWVYSEPQKGTTFKIYFPQIEIPEPEPEPQTYAHSFSAHQHTVLLVEDEDLVRQLVLDTLVAENLTVLEAANPLEALQIAESYQDTIDLLLTDVVMPYKNGQELYQQLSQSRPDIKVLYMSGYTNNVIINQGVLDEGVHFLQKPFTINRLLQAVSEVLRA